MEKIPLDYMQYEEEYGKLIDVPVFDGSAVNKMPELLASGYKPVSVLEVLEQRIKAWEVNDEKRAKQWEVNDEKRAKQWESSYFIKTGDSVVYGPGGQIKIVVNSPTLRLIHPNSLLGSENLLYLPEGTFHKVHGEYFSQQDVDKYTNKRLTKNELLNNPMWHALVQDKKDVLKEYVELIYSKGICNKLLKKYSKSYNFWWDEGMSINIDRNINSELESAFSVFNLHNTSNVWANYCKLNESRYFFVGIPDKQKYKKPESLRAVIKKY